MSTVSLDAVKSLIHFLSKNGIPRDKSLSIVELDESQLHRSRVLIDSSHYEALYKFAADEYLKGRFKIRNIGFEFGKVISPDRWGLITQIAFSSPNLEAALKHQHKYQTLVGDMGIPSIQKSANAITFDWMPTYRCCRHIVEETMTSWVTIARCLSTHPVNLKQVSFTHQLDEELVAEYEDYFSCRVESNSCSNRILTDRSILKSEFARYEPELYKLLKNHADKALSNLLREFPLDAITRFISRNLATQDCNVESCAKNLNVSIRTLQRHLSNHKLTFSMLADSIKQSRSVELVKDPNKDLTYVAHILGFSEQSSFSRAFKRWTGQSPRDFRATTGRMSNSHVDA
jgi:AraC-like DNA-binding protein